MSLLQRDARVLDCITASYPVETHHEYIVWCKSKILAEEIAAVIGRIISKPVEPFDYCTRPPSFWQRLRGERPRYKTVFRVGDFSVYYSGDAA